MHIVNREEPQEAFAVLRLSLTEMIYLRDALGCQAYGSDLYNQLHNLVEDLGEASDK